MSQSQGAAAAQHAPPLKFAALRHPGYRVYFVTTALAMMADNIEHVISYWVIFEKFQSPELGGFAVISHWVPFLGLSVFVGALADRFDPRRLIQIGMVLFMGVSIAWGVLFLTDTIQMWHAAVLLVVHGIAGVLWSPTSQVLLHDIVPREQLQSAVRLNATSRYLGLLAGPAVGGAILLLMTVVVTTVVLGVIGIHPWDGAGQAFVLGVAAAIAAPLGDLCESMIKRDLEVKDMGSILPGHGGLLDRFDALLFVLPVTYEVARFLDVGF